MLVHSTTLCVHQPFDTVMANSRVKTRSSEQTDDQYYPPLEVYALTWQGYVAHIVRMVSRIAMPFD